MVQKIQHAGQNGALSFTTRRQLLVLGAAGIWGGFTSPALAKEDGVGPNRGVVKSDWRGKQTCNNADVPASDPATRVTTPSDFIGEGCRMFEDSFEGPYFTCSPTPGKNIAEGQAGQPLTVAFRLIDGNCQPLPDGVIDVWACDATGHYSGYGFSSDERPPMVRAILFGHIEPDRPQRFCRGALRTDADGIAEFDTIYPGFYYGTPIHIHFKVHVNGRNLLTSQATFSEDWNERIMGTAPYNVARSIRRSTDDTGFEKMRIMERGGRLVATLDLVVPT
ncbi:MULTISPECIES: hypothetical protein [Phaeobacter]|uniref:dioxygenase family protein n=1 Tax=Phaeobacter TaxID=302485 RepID=UPI003A8B9331